MTRLGRYQLYACPSCSAIYKHPLWASVSIHVPRSINPKLDRECVKCGFKAPLEGWTQLGTVERFTDEERERRNAALVYSLGLGPRPRSKEKALSQRIRNFLLGPPTPVDPSEKYPLIKIVDGLE